MRADEIKKNYPHIYHGLGGYFPDADLEDYVNDKAVAETMLSELSKKDMVNLITELEKFLSNDSLDFMAISDLVNRKFDDEQACREWLTNQLLVFKKVKKVSGKD